MAVRKSPFGFRSRALQPIQRYQDNASLLAARVLAIHRKWTESRKAPMQPFGQFVGKNSTSGTVVRGAPRMGVAEPVAGDHYQ